VWNRTSTQVSGRANPIQVRPSRAWARTRVCVSRAQSIDRLVGVPRPLQTANPSAVPPVVVVQRLHGQRRCDVSGPLAQVVKRATLRDPHNGEDERGFTSSLHYRLSMAREEWGIVRVR